MPKVTCWKCPFTKKIYETRSGYRRHLLKLRKTRNVACNFKKLRQAAYNVAMNALEKARTLEEIEDVVMKHYSDMMQYAWGNSPAKLEIAKKIKMTAFSLARMSYSTKVSNSHSSPRKGKTNWGGYRDKEGIPKGYPGFRGYINYSLWCPKHEEDMRFVDFRRCLGVFGIHTGTGGGRGDEPDGTQKYGYDVKVFVDDFDAIKEHINEIHLEHEKEIFERRLKGEKDLDPVYDAVLGRTKGYTNEN